jgi:hypothetical protein
MTVVLAAGNYVHWGVFNVSVTNIAIIAVMIVVFMLAILIPFPHGTEETYDVESPEKRPS